jgi:hypothetical protein
MSLQYRNKSKSQLTSPTPAQLPAVALSAGHIVYDSWCIHFVCFVLANVYKIANYYVQNDRKMIYHICMIFIKMILKIREKISKKLI